MMATGVLDEAAAETAEEAADEAADAAVNFRMESLNSVPAWTLIANWKTIRRKKKLPLLSIFLFFAFFFALLGGEKNYDYNLMKNFFLVKNSFFSSFVS